MFYRLTAVALVLLVGCSLPLQPSGGTHLAFRLSVPSLATGDVGRLVAAETVAARVTVKGSGAKQTFEFSSLKGTLTVPLEPGSYDFLVEALDDKKRVLTAGQLTKKIVAGPNQASLTLSPVDTLADGSTWNLVADQAAYFTLPASNVDTLLAGPSSRFWVLASDGSFSGAGALATLTVAAKASDRVVRVVQSAKGTFTVTAVDDPPPPPPPKDSDVGITVDFTLPTDPTILGANDLVLNASKGDTATVDLASSADFLTYTWFIDGSDTYDLPPFKGFQFSGNALKIEAKYLSSGRHEVMIVVSDATGLYSARFVMEVVR